MQIAKKLTWKKVLVVLLILAGAALLGWLIWKVIVLLSFAKAKTATAPRKLPLAAPAVYVEGAQLSCDRETTVDFLETHPVTGEAAEMTRIRDRFVIRNDGTQAVSFVLAVPDVTAEFTKSPYFYLDVEGEVCDGWWTPKALPSDSFSLETLEAGGYLSALLPDWDGRSLPPEAEMHTGTPESMEGNVPYVTYLFAPLSLDPGEEKTVDVCVLRNNANLVLSFPKVDHGITCRSHRLIVNNPERTSIEEQNVFDAKTMRAIRADIKRANRTEGIGLRLEAKLDVGRGDYEIQFVRYAPVKKKR